MNRRHFTDLIHGHCYRGWCLLYISRVFLLPSSIYYTTVYAQCSPLPYRNIEPCRPSSGSSVITSDGMVMRAVEIVMLEKLDCILSKSATMPYIYEYKCECVRTHLCIDPSGRQQSPVIRGSPPAIRLTSGHTRLISGHKKTETYHAIRAMKWWPSDDHIMGATTKRLRAISLGHSIVV